MTHGLKAAPLSQTPEQVAAVIVAAVRGRQEQAWAPGPMRWVMTVLRHLPRAVFRKLPV
jgi:decaprenylphospho-beta-D-erythro-pentofuranosid-2-ulose 2-reductase